MSDLVPAPGVTEMVYGTTRAGKSAYQEWIDRMIQQMRPNAMQIIADTKPRYRAETEPYGPGKRNRRKAAYRYKDWRKGPTIPNSVVIPIWDAHPFRGLWRKPGEIAIMQSGEERDWMRMLVLLNAFTRRQIKDRERRIHVDEVLDFYHRNTMAINSRNDVFYRIARAGGERNIGLSLGAQQVKGTPPLIRKMARIHVLFHLTNDREDMRILNGNGIPGDKSPEGNWVFRRWETQPGGAISPCLTGRCTYPDSYLEQLAA